MRRRHLVVLVSTVTLLTSLFVLAVTIGVGVGTDAGREQIKNLIELQLRGRVHGKVHIGKVSGGLLTGFTLDTFAIRDLEDSLLISTGKVSLDYDPRDLMDRRLLLRNVKVEHPILRLRQYEKGDWNFQRIFASKKSNTPEVPGRGFGDFVVLNDVQVKDLTFLLERPWEPDDTLSGAKRDSAIRVNMANPMREIRRNTDGFTHTWRWSHLTADLPHVRIADPDSSEKFGQLFEVASIRMDELEPPFLIRRTKATVRKLGDTVFVSSPHFELPNSYGSGTAKIWWGSDLPVRLDINIKGDSVSMSDVAWVYPTLPKTGGGRTNLRIHNNAKNLHVFEYALTDMDLRTNRSRLTGAMTFVIGNPILGVTDVDLRFAPVNFDLIRTLAGAPFPVDWQGDLVGYAKGPGGPLNHFVVDESDVSWHDAHVAGAISRATGSGELDIVRPAYTNFHAFRVNASQIDLRSIEYLFPSFPRIGGTVSGLATLDSSWLDVRFSKADVTHRNMAGEPSRVLGSGRITYGDMLKFDVALNAQPLSLTMMSHAYHLGVKGLMSGPIRAKGTASDLQLDASLVGSAGSLTYSGRVDAEGLSIGARGGGRADALDLAQLIDRNKTPRSQLTGTYTIDIRGDTNDLGTLKGGATLQVERAEIDSTRVFASSLRARFADRRMYIDTLRVESVAGTMTAQGALGLSREISDSLGYAIVVDSLGGLRPYLSRLTSALGPSTATLMEDPLSGSFTFRGTLSGSVKSLQAEGSIQGQEMVVRRSGGRDIRGTFSLANVLAAPSGSVELSFSKLNFGTIGVDTLDATIRFEAAKTGTFSINAMATNGTIFDASGDLALSDNVTSVAVRDLGLRTDSSRWTLRGISNIRLSSRGRGIAIDSLVVANGLGGRVSVEAIVPDTGKARMFLRADSVSLYDVGRVLQSRQALSGWANMSAQGAGTNAAPVINVQTTMHDVRYGGIRVERVVGSAVYQDQRTKVAIDLMRGGRPALYARGSLPMDVRYFGVQTLDTDTLQATIRSDSASFDIVEALIPGLRDATGKLTANVDVAGTWTHPDLTGGLRVENGEVTFDTLGIRLKGVNIDIALFGHSDSLAIRRFVAWNGTNAADSVSLRGYIAYHEIDNPFLNLQLDARTFRALDRRALARLDVSTESGGVRLTGPLRNASLSGSLFVDRGIVYLPDPELAKKQSVDLVTSLVDTNGTTQSAENSNSIFGSISLDGVHITLGDEVWLRSKEANIKLGGSLNVQRSLGAAGIPAGKPVLEGTLIAERGTYALALGPLVQREFQVEGGTINFLGNSAGSLLEATELNISALHTVRTEGGADIRIRVRLTGPVRPQSIVTLESAESFPLNQSDLVAYLIFGQPNFELGSDRKSYAQLAAQTLLPSLQTAAATELRGVLGSWAEIIQVRPGAADPNAINATGEARTKGFTELIMTSRLGLEKQVSDNLFVSVGTGICQFGNQNNSTNQWLDIYNGLSGKLEFRLSPNSSLKAGKEPSAQSCDQRSAGRLVPTPTQWAFSLFKTWRF